MTAFADRLLALIGERSRNGFARDVGIGETSLRQYLAGGTPGLDKVVQIAAATGVSIEWLATGEGPREKVAESMRDSSRVPSHEEGTQRERGVPMLHFDPKTAEAADMVMIPVLDVQASAGRGLIAHSELPTAFVAFSKAYMREIGVNPEFADIIQVGGRSMIPTLMDRDWVLIDRSIDHIIDEALYAVVYGGMVLVKRVRMHRDGGVTLVSDNKGEGYEDEFVRPSEIDALNVVGRVKAHCRPM